MVEAEFVLGRIKAVLDRLAVALNLHDRVDLGPGRALGCEERQFAVRDMSSDQQAACPHPWASFTVIGSLDVSEFETQNVFGRRQHAAHMNAFARPRSAIS